MRSKSKSSSQAFEFNEWYLLQLIETLYGNLFSDYRHNNEKGASSSAPALAFSFVPGLPHVIILRELRQALISYQDYHVLLLTRARRPP